MNFASLGMGSAIVSILGLCSNSALAATQPVPGTYLITTTVIAGSACGSTNGAVYQGTFTYPGPSKPGAATRYQIGSTGLVVVNQSTNMPAAGATSWNGTQIQSVLPNGGSSSSTSFRRTLTFVDANSFFSTESDKNGCKTTSSYVYSGK